MKTIAVIGGGITGVIIDEVIAIAAGDILLFHPYESFEPVLRLIEEAAADPDVVANEQRVKWHTLPAEIDRENRLRVVGRNDNRNGV